MMDNRIFNVNGSGTELLLSALDLAFRQEGCKGCKAWRQTKENGLILMWHATEGSSPLPGSMTARECLPIVESWLNGDFAKTVELGRFCENSDHDGSNGDGWQVYCEDWGHVGGEHYSICAVRPAFMWYGK